jgi:hypothetical protein
VDWEKCLAQLEDGEFSRWLTIRGLSDSEFMMTSPFYQPQGQYQP